MTLLLFALLHTAQAGELFKPGPAAALQDCFAAIGRDNFRVVGFSENTGTLYYEIGKSQAVILRKNSGHEIDLRPEPACRPIDGGDFEKLAQQIEKGVQAKIKTTSPKLFETCEIAVRALGQTARADSIASLIKTSPGRPVSPVPPHEPVTDR
jgi:hypothetical protein